MSSFGSGSSGVCYVGGDDIDMDDGSIDIVDSIDVRQILGLNDDFLQE